MASRRADRSARPVTAQILMCLLARAAALPDARMAASLDAAGCATGDDATCGGARDGEASNLLQITKAKTSDWMLLEGHNCYPGHGAAQQEGPVQVSGYPECQSRFSGWDGVVMDAMQTSCWGINGIDQSQCVPGTPYSTYVKAGGGGPPPSFCGKHCTFATEAQDCGGECGLCDGQLCIASYHPPPPPEPPAPSFCGRHCTFATEMTDCGGECGLCDGMQCTGGSPQPQPPQPPGPPASWTLYEGQNCYQPDHGATAQSGPTPVSGYPECQATFSDWDGVVLDAAQTTCWGIRGIDQSKCVHGTSYSTYLKR